MDSSASICSFPDAKPCSVPSTLDWLTGTTLSFLRQGNSERKLFTVARLQGHAGEGRTALPTSASRVSSPRDAQPALPVHATPRSAPPRPARATHTTRMRSPCSGTRAGSRGGGLEASQPRAPEGAGDWLLGEEVAGSKAAGEAGEALASDERPGRLPAGHQEARGGRPVPRPARSHCGAGTRAFATGCGAGALLGRGC